MRRRQKQAVERSLARIGWKVSLKELCEASGLKYPADKSHVCQIRKQWLRKQGLEAQYKKIAHPLVNGTIRVQFGPHGTSNPGPRGKRKLLLAIIAKRGPHIALPTLIKAASDLGHVISYETAVSVRKQYCREHNIPDFDGRTYRSIPERDMDLLCDTAAITYLQRLVAKYSITRRDIQLLGTYFKSAKLDHAIRNMLPNCAKAA